LLRLNYVVGCGLALDERMRSMVLSIGRLSRKEACVGDDILFKFRRRLFQSSGFAASGLTHWWGDCRSSREVAYLLVLSSVLALSNAAIQPVSSQAFSTLTSTQKNTATYYTLSLATSNVSVTVLTVEYTTSTSLFTVLNIQFTTLTSFITRIQIDQSPQWAPSPPLSSRSGGPFRHQSDALSRDPVDLNVFFGYIESDWMLQLVMCLLIFLASVLLIFIKKR